MQAVLQEWTDHLISISTAAPEWELAVIWIVPVFLALLSRRPGIVLSSMLASGIAVLTIAEPRSIPLVLAVGAYLSAVLLAMVGIQIGRKAGHATLATIEAKLEKLESTVENLRQAEERRLFSELRGHDQAAAPVLVDTSDGETALMPPLPPGHE